MLSYARSLVESLVWNQSITIVASITALALGSIVASAAASALLRRHWKINLPAMSRLPLALLLFCLCDWVLLQALPRLRLSFSKDISSCLTASLVVRLLLFFALIAAALPACWLKCRQGKRTRGTAALFIAVNLAFSVIQVDAYIVEPLLVTTTEIALASADLDPAAPPVRIVHLTDTHIERLSYREEAVIDKVNALRPDIIVFTGDYINTTYFGDATAHEHFREFVAQLQAPYGIYATRGTVEPSPDYMANLIEGTEIVWLEQEAVTVNGRGQQVTLVGVNCDHDDGDIARLDQAMAGIPRDAFTLLLFHSPDLIHEAAAHGIDLYLGGHTHGGQLRLPFYGAIVTASKYGKRYEAGLFQEGGTTMVISRGIGFEGYSMPRARFLCPPEIVSIELAGQE
ncbi:MAG: metallophosphoesterase [Anaerolineae bacterium]|nr:metallophosphoesterase [Anaerolineae bacterium]